MRAVWLAVALGLGAGAGEPVSLIPGKSLGPLVLGKISDAEVLRILGKPDADELDEERPGSYAYYYSKEKWEGGQLVAHFNSGRLLDRVEFTSDRFHTSTGIGIDDFKARSDEFDVSQTEPPNIPGWGPDPTVETPDLYWLSSGGLGFFQFADKDKVEGMPPSVGYIAQEKAGRSVLYAHLKEQARKKEAVANGKAEDEEATERGSCERLTENYASALLMVAPSGTDGRTYFQEKTAEGWTKRKAYTVMGDVVLVRPGTAKRVEDGKGKSDRLAKHVCARYEKGTKEIVGWMSLEDLRAMPSTKAEWERIAPRLPVKGQWPSSARALTSDPFLAGDVTTKMSPSAKNKLCHSTRYDDECTPLELSGRYTQYQEDGVECGYRLFLFNNGILIESWGDCFGNHGQSSPDGFYLTR